MKKLNISGMMIAFLLCIVLLVFAGYACDSGSEPAPGAGCDDGSNGGGGGVVPSAGPLGFASVAANGLLTTTGGQGGQPLRSIRPAPF